MMISPGWWRALSRVLASMRRLLRVILMTMQEASYLSLELSRLQQVADGTGIFEELPLDLSRESGPPHDHRGPEAL